jgi:hypothetical protein
MNRSSLAAALIILTAMPITVLAAVNSDPEFRECGRAAMDRREQRMIDALAVYEGEWMAFQNERRVQLLEAWNNEDDRVRRDRQSDVIRDYNRNRRDADKRRDNEFRAAEKDYRREYDSCYQAFKARERARRDEERRRFDFN